MIKFFDKDANIDRRAMEKKTEIKPSVTFTVNRDKFKDALKNTLKHRLNKYPDINDNLLSGILLTSEQEDIVQLAGTDGYTALTAKIITDEPLSGKINIILNGLYLEKIKFNPPADKRRLDIDEINKIKITVYDDKAIITDVLTEISYTVPKVYGAYPQLEYVINIPKSKYKNKMAIAINPMYLARFTNFSKTIILVIDKQNPKAPIYIRDEEPCWANKGVIMPCIIRGRWGSLNADLQDKEDTKKTKKEEVKKMRNKIAKRIRRGLKSDQGRTDYQALKKIYKSLNKAIKEKLQKIQKNTNKKEQ